jgi:hypothetical protein
MSSRQRFILIIVMTFLALAAGCGENLSHLPLLSPPGPPTDAISYPVRPEARLEGSLAAVGPVTVNLPSGWSGVGFQCYSLTSLNAPSAVAGYAWWDGSAYQTGSFTVAELNAGAGTRRGFWVYATGSTSFSYSGSDASGANVSLKSGWNLITCPGTSTLGLADLTCTRDGQAVNVTSVLLPQVYEISGGNYTVHDLTAGGRVNMGAPYWVYSAASNVVLAYGSGPYPSPTPSPSPSPTGSPTANVGSLSGQVLSTSGSNLGGVNVTVDGRSTLTNDQGFFSLSEVAVGAGKVAAFTKAGYAPTFKTFTSLAADTTFFNTTMATMTTHTVSGASGGTVTESGGANLTFPANSLVGPGGTPFTGTANVSVKTFLPGDPSFVPAFPGEFTGVQGGVETGLISYGYLTVRLTDSTGAPLNLAPGKTATVKIPINSASDPGTPTIPFWYLNETTGKWDYGGLATRSADNRYYEVTATHFSSINLDQTITESSGFTKHVYVKNSAGQPVKGAWVYARQDNLEKCDFTDANGYCKVFRIGPNRAFQVWAQKGTLKSAVRNEMAGGPGTSVENTIILDQPVAVITTTWGATPRDLDAYLTGPTQSGGTFQVYYGSKGSLTSSPYALLNTDDRDGYGPEIITVARWFPGTYHFVLKVYTSGETFPTSGVAVEAIVPSLGVIRRYSPSVAGKRTWNVFDVVVDATGRPTLQDVNTYSDVVAEEEAPAK